MNYGLRVRASLRRLLDGPNAVLVTNCEDDIDFPCESFKNRIAPVIPAHVRQDHQNKLKLNSSTRGALVQKP